VWAGVDSVQEQEKLEARKMLENAAESHTSGAPLQDEGHPISQKKQGRMGEVYCQNGRRKSRTASIGETARLPWCTVVSGHDDLSTGGVADDPD